MRGRIGDWDQYVYTVNAMCKIENLLDALLAGLNRKEIKESGGGCVRGADSSCCTVETNTAV